MKTPASVLAVSVLALTAFSTQAAIVSGDIIGIDFGPTVPDNNYNQVDTTVSGTFALTRNLDGSAVNGVSFQISGLENTDGNGFPFSNNDGSTNDTYPSFLSLDDSNTTDFIGKYGPAQHTYTFTFTGLDDTLTYNFYGVSGFAPGLNRILYTNGTQTAYAVPGSNTGETLATLTGLASSGGSLSIVVAGESDNAIVNAIAVQAVPEPSAFLAVASGTALLLGWRRRRTA